MRAKPPHIYTWGVVLSLLSFPLLGQNAEAKDPLHPRVSPPQKQPRPNVLTFDGLLKGLSTMPGLEARFVEEKRIGLLEHPLINRGRIYYLPSGYLLRRVESPLKSEVLISAQSLRMRDAQKDTVLDLARLKDASALVQSLLWIFAGRHQLITDAFHVHFTLHRQGSPQWRARLRPKRESLRHLVAEIRLRGLGYALHVIHVIERQGDETITTITSADPKRLFTQAERQRLFRIK